MKKNKLLKFISVFQVIVFIILTIASVISLAMALFRQFEVTAVLNFINNSLSPIEEFYLYVINFFDTIYYSLEINTLKFTANIANYLPIIYTGIFTLFALLGLIFACVSSRAASGKTKGRGGVIVAFIINFLLAASLTAFAVYFFMYTKAIEDTIFIIADINFGKGGFTYDPLINKIVIYSVAGLTLFIMLFHFIGLCISKKEGYTKKEKNIQKPQKQSNKDMGSYKPKMKVEEPLVLTSQNKTADYMKYQDSKSANPYINGDSPLTEDDLFADLKPAKPVAVEPKKEEKLDFWNEPSKPATPTPQTPNNPFTNSSFVRPTQPTNNLNTTNQTMGYMPANSTPISNNFNQFNANNFNNSANNQFNNFARPMPYNQNMNMQTPMQNNQPNQNVQPAPTNINLTIQPFGANAGTNYQVTQTPTSSIPVQNIDGTQNFIPQSNTSTSMQTAPMVKEAPKSADEAFKAKPKAPTQAVAKPRQTEVSLTDKLKELSALRQSGAITDDEYKALKQKAFQKFLKS